MLVAEVGETPSLTQEFIGQWARGKLGSCIIPSLAPPPQAAPALQGGLPCPAEYLRPQPPLQLNRGPEQRNRAKIKEQSETSERELSNEKIANLSDGDFKALVIKMLTELIELGQKMKDQMKDTQNEIKQNIQGTNSGRKPGLRSTIWNKKKK